MGAESRCVGDTVGSVFSSHLLNLVSSLQYMQLSQIITSLQLYTQERSFKFECTRHRRCFASFFWYSVVIMDQ